MSTHDPPHDNAVDNVENDPVDALLRRDAADASPVVDDGFTAALMERLPNPTERPGYRWIVPAMGVLGFVIGLVTLSGGEDLSMLLTGLAHTRGLTLQGVLLAAIPLGVLYWLALGAAWQET